MTTDTAPVVAALRRLAGAEEACLCVHTAIETELCKPCWTRAIRDAVESSEVHGAHCQRCGGTGRVPLFRDAKGKARFRKECEGDWPGNRPRYTHEHCGCRGLGRLPLDIGEIHLEMLLLLAINNEHESLAGGQLFHTMMGALEARAQSAKIEQDLIEAAILALDAAVEARA